MTEIKEDDDEEEDEEEEVAVSLWPKNPKGPCQDHPNFPKTRQICVY